MRKNILLSILSIVLAILGCIGFVSCGKDDDGANNNTNDEKKYWITGLVRGYIEDRHDNTDSYSNPQGQDFNYRFMKVLDFKKDYIALEYELYSTESVEYLKRVRQADGKLMYDGKWTVMEEHPEWSYFNGTLHLFLDGLTDEDGINAGIVSPKQVAYSIDFEENRVNLYEEGVDWREPYYLNSNPSKTSWSELRNSSGYLMYIIWNPNDPLDNSKFDKSNTP